MWHLLQASPLQISPFGVCLLRRPLYPRDYLHPCDTDLPLGGPHTWQPLWTGTLATLATGARLNGLSNFTGWIKRDSYYHGLVARQGLLHKCPHLVGVVLPRWLQVTPSESRRVSQKKAETPATSSSAPSTEASKAQETHSDDVPAPMETGGVGDGRSWVDQVEASADDEFQRDRPAKCRQSQSRRLEDWPTLPFPLQDNEGRCSSAQQLYQHAGEQPWAHHNVAAQGITHLRRAWSVRWFGGIVMRGCVLRSLLGSYIHQKWFL